MTFSGWAQIALTLGLVFAAAFPLGKYMATIFTDGRTFLSPVLGPVERGVYAVCGVDPKRGMGWKAYVSALILLNALHFLLLYAILRLQDVLPWNPQAIPAIAAAPGVQHRHQLRHQHELAGLFAGKPDFVRRADDRPDGA